MSPGDFAELANCVSRLIEDPVEAKRLGAEGQRRVRKEHTWAAVAQRARQALDAARTRMADQQITSLAHVRDNSTTGRAGADCHHDVAELPAVRRDVSINAGERE